MSEDVLKASPEAAAQRVREVLEAHGWDAACDVDERVGLALLQKASWGSPLMAVSYGERSALLLGPSAPLAASVEVRRRKRAGARASGRPRAGPQSARPQQPAMFARHAG
jgi:hypothetical protein